MTELTTIQQLWSEYHADELYHFAERCPFCDIQLVAFKDEDGHPRSRGVCPNCNYKPGDNSTPEDKVKELTEKSRKNDAISFCRNTSVFSSVSVFNHKFINFNPGTSERSQVLESSKKLAQKIANGEIVHAMLNGGTGSGKTHMAISVMWQVMELTDYRFKACFVDVHELITQLKNSFSGDKSMTTALNRTIGRIKKKADLVILDDLGVENAQGGSIKEASSYNTDVVTDIINAREDRSLIVTSNLKGGALREMYGNRILSRITVHSDNNNINFDGIPDYRITGKKA